MTRTRFRLGHVLAPSLACSDPVTSRVIDEGATTFSIPRVATSRAKQGVVDLTRCFTYAIYPQGVGQNLVQTFSPTRNRRIGWVRLREGIGGPIRSDRTTVALQSA